MSLVQENIYALVALVLIYLPVIVIRRLKRDWVEFALTWKGASRSLRVALVVAAVTLPPYALGFHLWQTTVAGATLDPSWDNYLRWPQPLQGSPARLDAGGANVWLNQDDLSVQLPPRVHGRIAAEGTLVVRAGTALVAGGEVVLHAAPHRHTVTVSVRHCKAFSLSLLDAGEPLSMARIRLGPDGRGASEPVVSARREVTWLILFILTQFLLVALSEEFFYRGYLQTRLDEAFPPTTVFLGARLGRGIIVASAVFALTHLAAHQAPIVLAVFFPSLLFGWIRARTGSIVGAILYHGLCNVWVQLLAVHYR